MVIYGVVMKILTEQQRVDTAGEAEDCVNVLNMHISALSVEIAKETDALSIDGQLAKLRGLVVARDYVKAEHFDEE